MNKKIRGTMKEVSNIEVGIDTVYVRSNIERIEENGEDGFIGWEYNEKQYDKDEYFEMESIIRQRLEQEDLNNKEAIAELYVIASMGGI